MTGERVLMVTVSAVGGVSAELEPTPPASAASVQSYDTLEGFCESHGVGADVPVIRFDRADWARAVEFSVRGPMRSVGLPAGMVHRPFQSPVPWAGESWDAVGSFTYVSADVYLQMATAAGIPWHTYGARLEVTP